jgi:hypothetical protein
MSTQSMNPLIKHFRQPAIHLTLPSGGKYWEQGSLNLNLSGQLAIYPMTTRDEIAIRTPDALLNGESIVSLIQSCCPEIVDAWKAPTIDVDALLIAIRIASYGQNMDIDTLCPSDGCKHENTHALDLSVILDGVRAPNYNQTIDTHGLKIKLRPLSYYESNKVNLLAFEEQRILQVVSNDDMDEEEKVEKFNQHMKKMVDINLNLLSAGTEYIETEDGQQVSNQDFINEFYNNCDNKIIREVRKRFDEISEMTKLPNPRVRCEECSLEYPVEVKFDYARFFATAS